MSTPNVLLVVLDTARAQTVFPGLQNGVMPVMGRIAEEGTTFRNTTSVAPWTLPSHASLFTGQYTSDHGTDAGQHQFEPFVTPLAARLSEQGYTTTGISSNIWVSPEFGFDAGFDQFSMKWDLFWDGADLSRVRTADGARNQLRELRNQLSAANAPKTMMNALYGKFLSSRYDDGAWLTTRRAARWITNRESDDPFFFFINYLEPHLTYDPPAGYAEKFLPADITPEELEDVNQDQWRYIAGDVEMSEQDFRVLEALYKGELNYLDLQLGYLYRSLSKAGVLDDTAIIIVADHGENIGDHGLMDHQYCLYETLVNVPLIVRYPDRFDPGSEVDGLVELRDVYPTVLELAGIDPASSDATVSENSLVPNAQADFARDRVIAEYLTPQPSLDALKEHVTELPAHVQRYDRALRSIRVDDWKLIEGSDGSIELYELDRDPGETTDVSDDNPEVVDRLTDRLERERGTLQREGGRSSSISDRNRQRLEDLGYLQ